MKLQDMRESSSNNPVTHLIRWNLFVYLGSDQATLLIYHDKDSKDRCVDSLKAHFQGQNQHFKCAPTSP